MSDKRTFILQPYPHPSRERAIEAIKSAQDGFVVEIKPATRSGTQNAKLHSILTDISRHVVWGGQKLPMEVWKRLCMASWLREEGGAPMLIPALDGNGVDIVFERTSKLTVKQCASLIEWCLAFGSENGVEWTPYE